MHESSHRENVIEKYLQGLHHEDGYSNGYLKSDDELKLFGTSLAAVYERYAVQTSRCLNKSSKSNVVFSMIHSECRISLDYVPFRVVKETVKGSSTTDWPKEVYEKKRMNLQGTKKGCAATMTLKWIELYPDFQVNVPQPCGQTNEGRLKAEKAKQLQEALDAKQQTVNKETRLYIIIADCSSHRNHGVEDMEAFSQNMDRNIAERIHMLAREGTTCVKGEEPESFIVYRPYASRSFVGSSDSSSVEGSVAGECEDTLLLCFQKIFMRNMLNKYGGSVVCLDATHETSDYALPLFLLVVKTPSGYTPAGVFIIQFETADCIAEALGVFKQWCDNSSPQYWMVDYSKPEISAIKQVFPESQISIFDFHRLRAWQRWLRRKEDVSDPDEALRLMKRLASASNQDEFEKACEVPVASEHWKNAKKDSSYFEAVLALCKGAVGHVLQAGV
ncbi:hypothetical protein HPB50_023949 [Hyalomma asiaticum]|uniref:Uncharacterized protein n=1 Tax=Hyalomma asiaticum TaxID=266040 RepID=A0ACB7S3U3_HYAAI|nr:hypothetical protein HPB50_023949 [Hyalomma asiaticum]